jgi:hypothetical protein
MNKDTCFDADMNYKSCSMAQRSPDAIPQTSALHLRKVALVTRLNLRKLGSTSFVHGQHYAMRSRRYRILGEKRAGSVCLNSTRRLLSGFPPWLRCSLHRHQRVEVSLIRRLPVKR